MKIMVELQTPFSKKESGTIIVDKRGLRTEEKEPVYLENDSLIRELIRQAIDTAGWSHSWHIDISKAKKQGSAERKTIRGYIDERIARTETLLSRLRATKAILGRWHY